MADHPAHPVRRDHRPGPRRGQTRVRSHDDHGQDRHQRDRGGAARLTRHASQRGRHRAKPGRRAPHPAPV
ncbi:hypothetical protein G6F23_016078 [Rhizopus arrhizus]|nr:hypothetical protein G6F23_016078 [Rhizopus arrhizus]